ncbi:MAG: hypothetical protein IPM16_06845 [Chloroflexi bacterium]|nr:hypothetical protein [Chloroflexota bacterium]
MSDIIEQSEVWADDQLDAPLTAEDVAEAEYSEMMHRSSDPNDDEPLTGDYGGAGSERCPECGFFDYAGEYYCPVCGGEL